MKLYAWQPEGHGPQSFFVVAASQQEAQAAVAAEIQRCLALPRSDPDHLDPYDVGDDRWAEDHRLTIAEPGKVVMNSND